MPVLALGLGGGLGAFAHVFRHAGHLCRRHQKRPLVGGIQHVFAEFLAQFGLALLDGCKAGFGLTTQFGARQHKVAQRVVTCFGLLGVERCWVHGLVLGVQAFVGAHAGPKLGHPGQGGVVRGAQLGRVGHGLQMADHAPSAAQPFGGHIQHLGHGRPLGGETFGTHLLQSFFGMAEQFIHRAGDVFGLNRIKQGQVGKVEKRIGVCGHGFKQIGCGGRIPRC